MRRWTIQHFVKTLRVPAVVLALVGAATVTIPGAAPAAAAPTLLFPVVEIVSPAPGSVVPTTFVDVKVRYQASTAGALLGGVHRVQLLAGATTIADTNIQPGRASGTVTLRVPSGQLRGQPSITVRARASEGLRLLPLSNESASVTWAVDDQGAALDRLLVDSRRKPMLDTDGRLLRMVYGQFPFDAATPADPVARSLAFVGKYRTAYALQNPAEDLFLARIDEQPGIGPIVTLGQRHDGIPVFGAFLNVAMNTTAVTGTIANYLVDLPAAADPLVSAARANQLAISAVPAKPAQSADEARLVWFHGAWFDQPAGGTRLAWKVEVRGKRFGEQHAGSWTVLVDADDSSILLLFDSIEEHGVAGSRPGEDFLIKDAAGVAVPFGNCDVGTPVADELGETVPGTFASDPFAQPAWTNLHAAYAYFFDTFGRRGADGAGGQSEVVFDAAPSSRYVAWFDPHCDRMVFPVDEASDLGTMAHEFTHSVDFKTASLVYQGESGAAAEGFAVIFATLAKNVAWGPIQPDSHSKYIRSCPNPGDDNGCVHFNRQILYWPAYLAATGDDHNGVVIADPGIGRTKVGRLFHNVLTARVAGAASLRDVSNAAVAEARRLADEGGPGAFTNRDVCIVINSFAAVRLGNLDTDCNGYVGREDADPDHDLVFGSPDNCPLVMNRDQRDTDEDGFGDACDSDPDNDGDLPPNDNCPVVFNRTQTDINHNGRGDACEDSDGDGLTDEEEILLGTRYNDRDTDRDGLEDTRELELGTNPTQANTDGDCAGTDAAEGPLGTDPLDRDTDDDGLSDGPSCDNCGLIPNADQIDNDGDRRGDACDNCPALPNPDQADNEADGLGDACDDDDDNDTVTDGVDSCPLAADAAQIDLDHDGVGTMCDDSERAAFSERGAGLAGTFRFPSLTAPVRIPIGLCVLDGCPDHLRATSRLTVDLDMGGAAIKSRVVDDHGKAATTVKSAGETLGFAPRADAYYKTPGGSKVRDREYVLEIYPPAGALPDQDFAISIASHLT